MPSEVISPTPITLSGPLRRSAQLLAAQSYDGHKSVHDAESAAKLGLAGAPIEGPTHFSQFEPLGAALWGERWFSQGCISAHFQTMVVESEQVQAEVQLDGLAPARRVSWHARPMARRCSKARRRSARTMAARRFKRGWRRRLPGRRASST